MEKNETMIVRRRDGILQIDGINLGRRKTDEM